MAKKKSPTTGGTALVIVESPAKARTINKFLGKGYTVEASIGHVRDLPRGAKEIPEKFKGEDWAHLGVNVNKDFDPIYIVPGDKTKQVKKLKDLLKNANELYLATDEDREGEAISWHLFELLKPKVPVRRLVFHEITKTAIEAALANPREINIDLVRAQETRRIVDRLFGYEVSPLLWRKIRPKLSAGRVQSVSVRMIVEREQLRMAFHSATFWDLIGQFSKTTGVSKTTGENFDATLVSVDNKKIPAGKDFDPSTGKLKNPDLMLLDEDSAQKLATRLGSATFRVTKIDDKPYTSRPYPPFTTSTMQQESNRKLGYTARRTMQIAQSLYENGHITYMRTDSTILSQQAIKAARDLVKTHYGDAYLPAEPRTYKSKVKNAQEAHEAIRPAGHPFEKPDNLRSKLTGDEYKLFEMIWKRTIASQMTDAQGRRITIRIEADGALFQVSGKTIDFAGFLRAYVEGSDDPMAELADKETILPNVEVGEEILCRGLSSKSHTTQPPARFTEASLTRSLEEMGIGRPSTYASIIETILARNYVFKKGSALVPTWTAFSVARLLVSHLPDLIDYQFTAQMEDDLDAISRGESKSIDYLKSFYFGNGSTGLKKQLENKIEEIDARQICSIPIGKANDGTDEDIIVRVGRYGPFIEKGDQRASLPEGLPPDELNVATCMEMLERAAKGDEPLGVCPDTEKPVFLKVGRFGPYIQRGSPDDDEKPQNASLLKGMDPADIDLALALKLLTLPRILGQHPEQKIDITAFNGRYGPYVKCGDETRSLPADVSPLEVGLAAAVELLAQPKKSGRGRAAKREPIKVFDESPVTENKIELLEGRYGPYVTDGETNASIPRDTPTEEVTFDLAIQLLADRAAKGPSKKKKKSAKKKTAKKKATKKKVVKKKTTKKAVKKRGAKKAVKRKASAKPAVKVDTSDAPF